MSSLFELAAAFLKLMDRMCRPLRSEEAFCPLLWVRRSFPEPDTSYLSLNGNWDLHRDEVQMGDTQCRLPFRLNDTLFPRLGQASFLEFLHVPFGELLNSINTHDLAEFNLNSWGNSCYNRLVIYGKAKREAKILVWGHRLAWHPLAPGQRSLRSSPSFASDVHQPEL